MTHKDYIIHPARIIGSGCSDVVQATHIVTGKIEAAKLIDLDASNRRAMLQTFYNEALIFQHLNSLGCPHIVQLSSSSICNNKAILILEKMDTDLLELILENRLTIHQKMNIFQEICFGLKQCHDNGVAHLDIKPENVLINFEDGKFVVKLTDFGGSQVLNGDKVYNVYGTLNYNAPEVFTQSENGIDAKQADIWSLGILLHVLLSGAWPIPTDDPVKVRKCLAKGTLQFSKSLTSEQVKLIAKLLRSNPTHRPDIDTVIAYISTKKEESRRKEKRTMFQRISSFTNLRRKN